MFDSIAGTITPPNTAIFEQFSSCRSSLLEKNIPFALVNSIMAGQRVHKAAARASGKQARRYTRSGSKAISNSRPLARRVDHPTPQDLKRSKKRKVSDKPPMQTAKCYPENTAFIQQHLLRLLRSRQNPKTICPSEIPRALSQSDLQATGHSEWKDLMPLVRTLLFEMRSKGEVEILQKGEVIPRETTMEDISGPIRARLVPPVDG